MNPDNKIVHALWIGDSLSVIELLCIRSFIAMGHEFHLWLYESLKTALPDGLIIEDASAIISSDGVFRYRNKNQFGHGKGSYAGFSDIFRYKLLYEKGGWWTDMDVICLKPLDFSEPYVFRTHHELTMVGNIMKCPLGSVVMKRCFERAMEHVNAENTDWNLPIRILNEEVKSQELQTFIKSFTNKDSWLVVRKLLYKKFKPASEIYAIHLLNEEWRRNRIDKNAIPAWGFIGKQLKKHALWKQTSFLKQFRTFYHAFIPSNGPEAYFCFFKRIFWKPVRHVKHEKQTE